MGSELIQADYDCLHDVAAAFAHEADGVTALTYRMGHVLDALHAGGWTGLGASAFFAEMNELVFPALGRLADGLQDASEATMRLGRVLLEAEEAAAALFRGFLEAMFGGSHSQGDSTAGSGRGGPDKAALTALFPELGPLVDFFWTRYSAGSGGVDAETLAAYIGMAQNGDTRAQGVLFGIMLGNLQADDWAQFESIMNAKWYGEGSGYGGNCANFVSLFLHYGMGLPFEEGWMLNSQSPRWGTSSLWYGATGLKDYLIQRATETGDISITVINGTQAGLYDTDNWNTVQPDATINNTITYGDVVYFNGAAYKHVAVVAGFGPADTGDGSRFFPTYEEALAFYGDDVELTPWVMDHGVIPNEGEIPAPRAPRPIPPRCQDTATYIHVDYAPEPVPTDS